MLFSLFKGIIIKKEGTHSWQESVSSFQNTFQRKYPNVMIRILNLFCKLKNIKLSDQEWFDRAIAKLNLLEQVCPYCDSKGQMIFHDSYPRYMITLKANHIETEILRIPRVPILLPAVQAVGVSPLFFVVFLVITLSFGLITPPVGVCLYAAQNVTDLPLEKIIKASIPWIALIAIALCIFIIFPGIITTPVKLIFGS